MAQLLIVDDEESLCQLLQKVLRGAGHEADVAYSGEEALQALAGSVPAVLITDLKMPGMDGLALLRHVRDRYPQVLTVIMTAHGSIETAVEAMKLGAFDYLTKPFKLDEVKLVVERALTHARHRYDDNGDGDSLDDFGLLGRSEPMQRLRHAIRQAGPTDASILIRGETGTGKELVARAIHAESQRADGPFVKLNCAALPETLLESELFGHERGAFTGATMQKAGRFERAHKGTIFLDEIGDISPATQVRLLRVLQEREFERVGGTQTLRVDVRVIAATHRDLEAAVAAGEFRQDLYYRLNVVPIEVPRLADRADDLPLLVEHFFQRHGAPDRILDPEALALLQSYSWPGNVRELENLVQRLIVLTPHREIRAADLPVMFHATRGSSRAPAAATTEAAATTAAAAADVAEAGLTLQEMERRLILRTLEEVGGKRAAAAERLGISVRTLQYKLKQYEADGEADR